MVENEIPWWLLKAFSALVAVFAFGSVCGSLRQKDREQEAKIKSLEDGMNKILMTDSGEPLFITRPVCKGIREDHAEKIALKLENFENVLLRIEKAVVDKAKLDV